MMIDQELPVWGICIPANTCKAKRPFSDLRHGFPKEPSSPLLGFDWNLLFCKRDGDLLPCSWIVDKVAVSRMFVNKFQLPIFSVGFLLHRSRSDHPRRSDGREHTIKNPRSRLNRTGRFFHIVLSSSVICM
jgi:hypothetical protein